MSLFFSSKITPLDLRSSHNEQSLWQNYEFNLKMYAVLKKRYGKSLLKDKNLYNHESPSTYDYYRKNIGIMHIFSVCFSKIKTNKNRKLERRNNKKHHLLQ